MTDRLSIFIGLTGLTSFLLASLSFGSIWVFYFETPYLKYLNAPFPTVGAIAYHAGDSPELVISRCNSYTKNLIYSSTRFLLNETTLQIVELSNIPMIVLPGCQTDAFKLSQIPANTVPGTYHLYGVSTVSGKYAMHAVPWETQSFRVTP